MDVLSMITGFCLGILFSMAVAALLISPLDEEDSD